MSFRHVRTDEPLWYVSMITSLAIIHGDFLEVIPVHGDDPNDIVAVQQKIENDADLHGQWVAWNGLTAEFTPCIRDEVAA